MKVYFDNAATTPMLPEVFEKMKPYFLEYFGNPSSTHGFGRQAKTGMEAARKQMASDLGVATNQLFFTSGATEANNIAIRGAVKAHSIKTIICSPIEHPAVLNTVNDLAKEIEVIFLNVDNTGSIHLEELKSYLQDKPNTLVSIMHANNEIGNINPIEAIAMLCKEFGAIFHCDTVQTIGLGYGKSIGADLFVGSAHKFHGPKGVGFLVSKIDGIESTITGGGQERGVRSGTENISGIVGMAESLKIACSKHKGKREKLLTLKKSLISELKLSDLDIDYNGLSFSEEDSLPNIVNIKLPLTVNSMLLFNLDIAGIAVSGGSACSSGALKGSQVLSTIDPEAENLSLRISFNENNSIDEIEYFVKVLKNKI